MCAGQVERLLYSTLTLLVQYSPKLGTRRGIIKMPVQATLLKIIKTPEHPVTTQRLINTEHYQKNIIPTVKYNFCSINICT